MSSISVAIESNPSDKRSNEIAFTFVLDNPTDAPVYIAALSPVLPEGATLPETKDLATHALATQHQALCAELTEIANAQLMLASAETRKRAARVIGEIVREAYFNVSKLFGYVAATLFKVSNPFHDQVQHRLRALGYTIGSVADAEDVEIALGQYAEPELRVYADLFGVKLAQLRRLEGEMHTPESRRAIAVVEAQSSFSTTYVLRFRRSTVNQRKYSFNIEATVYGTDSEALQVKSASARAVISPAPYALSLTAIFAALLGSAVAFLTGLPGDVAITAVDPKQALTHFATEGLVGVILAMVAFNAYENIDAFKKMEVSASWRGALLVGFLCGAFTERIIDALKVLVGAQ
ncbi:hypothetical protein ACQ5SO_17695 [Rhodovulum sp. DZ06]|uniref:hypothetical protein n=1 Tax=Rhodovulum sp. DZ06 TaxID=3425126 RepID=UPI003D33BF4A